MVFRGFVQTRCQFLDPSHAAGGEAAPAAGIEPILTVSGGVDVNRDENHLVFT